MWTHKIIGLVGILLVPLALACQDDPVAPRESHENQSLTPPSQDARLILSPASLILAVGEEGRFHPKRRDVFLGSDAAMGGVIEQPRMRLDGMGALARALAPERSPYARIPETPQQALEGLGGGKHGVLGHEYKKLGFWRKVHGLSLIHI